MLRHTFIKCRDQYPTSLLVVFSEVLVNVYLELLILVKAPTDVDTQLIIIVQGTHEVSACWQVTVLPSVFNSYCVFVLAHVCVACSDVTVHVHAYVIGQTGTQ